MAGFQVSMYGRFWVSTEGREPETTPAEARGDVLLLHRIFHAIKRPLAT